ncbi:MAG: ASKHA domain-containing protein [Thermoplasmatota archaeon]
MGRGGGARTIVFRPSGKRVRVEPGTDLVSAARLAGLSLGGVCGGAGTCGKCRVFVSIGGGRREVLACRTRVRRSMTVFVPPETLSHSARILTEGVFVSVEPRPYFRLVGRGRARLLAVGEGGELHRLRRPLSRCLGVALDLGTTTLVASLFDLSTGRRLAVAASLNPQTAIGEDVVSRISFALGGVEHTKRLRSLLVAEVRALVAGLCERAGADASEIFDICAVGNTFMHHCFLGLPLGTLAEAPYAPAAREARVLGAAELGLRAHSLARVYLPPVVAGFLGSDAVAGALAAGLDRADAPTLYMDLGTNSEVLLAFNGTLFGATAAAGPAFEGAEIECGMRAADGAISSVRLAGGLRGEGGLALETIGGAPARGLAGSGLVDAVAALLDAGALDRSGALRASHPLVESGPQGRRVVLSRRPAPVYISQADVRSLQLAKAAISAAASVLLRRTGIPPSGLRQALLAGAFGNYLDRRSAMRVGLLPPIEEERVLSVGNAASTGAGVMLVSTAERRRAEALAERVRYVEMAGSPDFREEFIARLGFP